jgi:predicted nuclease of restriction endonuclease-like RecB superfamily
MLAAPLLRVRTTRNGSIVPLFCTRDEETGLAKRLIQEFEAAWKNRERKAELDDRISEVESEYKRDFKLVRGLCALLERRCTFESATVSTATTISAAAANVALVEPAAVRKALFEESSRRGFALTDMERKEIIDIVASRLHLSADAIASIMWSDLDDNLILEKFDAIDAKSLVGWYNLALVQTLLFNCTKLEFSVSGGLNWKRILRRVKRLGLMYYLQQEDHDKSRKRIVCSIEGPLSLFRLTDRYGTALARLLPSIVVLSKGSEWRINAWIMRRTMEGKRTLYEFNLSDSEAPSLLTDPFYYYYNNNNEGSKRGEELQLSPDYFDSAVEEKFARRFEAAAAAGWKLVREPDPLIVSDGRALIPDFMFEKYGKRVYLEIVGFWTPEYLERKLKKLADIIIGNYNAGQATDLFIALNKDLACSNAVLSSLSFHLIPKERLILYGSDAVPIKPVLDYLKSIDKETAEQSISNPNLKAELDRAKDVISIDEIVIENKESNCPSPLPPEVVMKIALRDHGDRYMEVAGTHLISKEKAGRLESLLAGVSKFTDACAVLAQNEIPELCQAELVSKLGYDVVWQSMDPGSAVIVKKRNEKKESDAA